MTFASIEGATSRLPAKHLSSEYTRRFAERFPAKLRDAVGTIAASDPRLAQAMHVFPGVMAELVRMPPESRARAETIRSILDGAPLKDVARAACLPLWLRRLPPEAFVKPVPKGLATLLPSAAIANHLPRSPKQAARWLETVIEAARVCDGRFAVWVAREQLHRGSGSTIGRIRALGLFAWHASHTESRSPSVPNATWSADQSCGTANALARRWYEQVELALMLDSTVSTPWLARRSALDLDFVPLLTAEEIDAEAKAMRNCLLTYGYQVRTGRTQLWSIRRRRERMATLAVKPLLDSSIVIIQQLAAADNNQAAPEVWMAAYHWIAGQSGPGAPRRSNTTSTQEPSRAAWSAAWRPYWLGKRGLPAWLPLAPARSALMNLRNAL